MELPVSDAEVAVDRAEVGPWCPPVEQAPSEAAEARLIARTVQRRVLREAFVTAMSSKTLPCLLTLRPALQSLGAEGSEDEVPAAEAPITEVCSGGPGPSGPSFEVGKGLYSFDYNPPAASDLSSRCVLFTWAGHGGKRKMRTFGVTLGRCRTRPSGCRHREAKKRACGFAAAALFAVLSLVLVLRLTARHVPCPAHVGSGLGVASPHMASCAVECASRHLGRGTRLNRGVVFRSQYAKTSRIGFVGV